MTVTSIKQIRDDALAESNSGLNVHDHLKSLSIPELQAMSAADRLPWHTMAINVTGDLNVGTIVRTSHLLGAASVIVVGRTKIDRRSMVGAANYIKVEKFNTMNEHFELNVDEISKILKDRNLTPIFCESGGINLPKANWPSRIAEMSRHNTQPCLVMGNETGGIPPEVLELSNVFPNSFVISIPQHGVIRSFNVAVAHSIISGNLVQSMNWM